MKVLILLLLLKFEIFASGLQISNLTYSVGKSAQLNCSLNFNTIDLDSLIIKPTTTSFNVNKASSKFNPTWLKADLIYDHTGSVNGYKTENIIVTRKGIITDTYRDRIKLINLSHEQQLLVLNKLEVKDEGKYICKDFNNQIDRFFFISVLSPIKDVILQFNSDSKYFRDMSDLSHIYDNYGSKTLNTISIKENDELMITCIVNSSKPSANLTIWLTKQKTSSSSQNQLDYDYEPNESKKLDIFETHVTKNKDLTLKTIVITKLKPSRYEHQKVVSCSGENSLLNDKAESKHVLNVYHGPKCNRFQKTVYNTGINQTVELECHMSESNPPYLDFNWNFLNQDQMKERTRSSGFISRINWTPRSEKDFGEITCLASNGIEIGECKIRLELGGPPNPPYDCYHKENNKTIIIECKPGYEQGDPEVYFYLLKKKSSGALVEYARKRDSCSFLISNLILEEHLNEFFIYSSNKFGNNKEKSSKIIIENREFLLRNSNRLETNSLINNGKNLSLISGLACFFVFVLFLLCCFLMRCKKETSPVPKKYTSNICKHDSYKYNPHKSNYNNHFECYEDQKSNYHEPQTNSSSSDINENSSNLLYDNQSEHKYYNKFKQSSVLNSIQNLEMSPRSKVVQNTREAYEFEESIQEEDEDEEENQTEYENFSKLNQCNKNYDLIQEKINIWYNNTTSNNNNNTNTTVDSIEDSSGISVDRAPLNQPKIINLKSFLKQQDQFSNDSVLNDKKMFNSNNETISLNVDDEKCIGILV